MKHLFLFIVGIVIIALSTTRPKSLTAEWTSISIGNYEVKRHHFWAYIFFNIEVTNHTSDTLYYIDAGLDENQIYYSLKNDIILNDLRLRPEYELFPPKSKTKIKVFARANNEFIDSIGIRNFTRGRLVFKSYSLNNPRLTRLDSIEAIKNENIEITLD